MTAKRFAIIEAVEGAMLSISGVEEVLVNASGDPTRFNAIFITDGGQSADSNTEPGCTRYSMQLKIEGYVAGGDGKEATANINALYLDVVNAVMSEAELQSLCEVLDEGALQVETVVLSKLRRMGFALDLNIEFVADRENPATA